VKRCRIGERGGFEKVSVAWRIRKPWAARAREAWAARAPFDWGRRRYVLGHFVGRVSGLVGGSPSFFGGS